MTIKTGQLKKVFNQKRKFGSSDSYYVGYVKIEGNVDLSPIIFTADELHNVIDRAIKNPEDMPKRRKSFLEWLFG